MYTLTVVGFVLSTSLTSAANAIFLEYLYPLLVAVGAWVFFRESPNRRTRIGTAMGMAGVVIIVAGSWDAANLAGVGYGLICAVGTAGFVLLQRNIRVANSLGQTSLYNLMAALLVLPLAYKHLAIAPAALGLVALAGVLQLGVPYAMFIRGLRTVPLAEAALLTLLEPVLNPVWVWIIVGERPSVPTLIGGAAILGALGVHFVSMARAARQARLQVEPLAAE
jgi:drug/metabolite transporter (DMT)-like permease